MMACKSSDDVLFSKEMRFVRALCDGRRPCAASMVRRDRRVYAKN